MRRWISHLLFWILLPISVAAAWVIWRYFHDPEFYDLILDKYAWKDEMFALRFFYVAGAEAIVALIAYGLGLDARRGRPWLSMIVGGLAPGITAGAALVTFVQMDEAPLPWYITAAAGGAILSVLVLLAIEFFNRWLWGRVMETLDRKDMGGAALAVSRLALLWRPGQTQLLRSVAMERFRRGSRGEVATELRALHAGGDRSPELLELLCQLSNEEEKPAEFLVYLRDLFEQFPDDEQLRSAYSEELLSQGHRAEALEIMRRHGIPETEEALGVYATLLAESGDLDEAVSLAEKLGELEGIPMQRSDKVLREVIAKSPEHLEAVNLLAAHSERMARRDQQMRWLEKSLSIKRRQPAVRRKLLKLYEAMDQTTKVEDMLSEMVADQPADFALGLRYANVLFSNGKLDEAAEYLGQMGERGCTDPMLYVLRSRALLELQRLDEAREIAAKGLEAKPDEEVGAKLESILKQVERAALTAELAQLVEESRENPQDLPLVLRVLDRLAGAGHSDRAVGHADLILNHHPDARTEVIRVLTEATGRIEGGFPMLNYLADLQVAEGKYDDALATIKRMAERSLDRLSAMREGSQKILRRSPHHLNTLRTLGELYEEHGQFTEMVHSYSLYLGNGGEGDAQIDRALVRAYISLDDYENAAKFLPKLLEESEELEEHQELLENFIRLAIDAGHAETAAEFHEKLTAIAPTSETAQGLQKEIDSARSDQRLAFLKNEVDQGKGDSKMLEEMGDICREQKDLNQAIAFYQRAARQSGATRIPTVKLAWCFAQKGMYDLTGETLSELKLSLGDSSGELSDLMSWLYMTAQTLEEAHLFERATKLYKQLMKIDAGYSDVLERVEKLTRR
ncbi:tetratricopeptide repeat protein [bacterium]|nr:tetratricopeptide repeat protein [bacterium]